MRVVALVSGGKDSIFSIMECVRNGHEVAAVAHLKPPPATDELDSWMYQTVASNIACAMGECLGVPLYTAVITGTARHSGLQYAATDGDEVEDLLTLLRQVLESQPDIAGVCSGAILSDYQRLRVESVAQRLGLVSLAYLWQREQGQLLQDMIASGLEAVLVKVAGMGLKPARDLGQSLAQMQPRLLELNSRYGSHICGEGGEFESTTLDCPLFVNRIVIDKWRTVIHSDDMFAPVAYMVIEEYHLEPKKTPLDLGSWRASQGMGSEPDAEDAEDSEPVLLHPVVESTCTITPQSRGLESQNMDVELINRDSHVRGTCVLSAEGGTVCVEGTRAEGSDIMSRIITTLADLLHRRQLSLANITSVWLYIDQMDEFKSINTSYVTSFRAASEGLNVPPPSRCCLELAMDASVRMVCRVSSRERVRTVHVQSISYWAPACIGPYAQAVVDVSKTLHSCGSIAMEPRSLQIQHHEGATVAQQLSRECRRALRNLNPVLGLALNSNDITTQLPHLVSLTRVEAYIACEALEYGECSGPVPDAVVQVVDQIRHWARSSPTPEQAIVVAAVPRMPRDALVEVVVGATAEAIAPVRPTPCAVSLGPYEMSMLSYGSQWHTTRRVLHALVTPTQTHSTDLSVDGIPSHRVSPDVTAHMWRQAAGELISRALLNGGSEGQVCFCRLWTDGAVGDVEGLQEPLSGVPGITVPALFVALPPSEGTLWTVHRVCMLVEVEHSFPEVQNSGSESE